MQGTQYATKRSILCRGAFCGPTVLNMVYFISQIIMALNEIAIKRKPCTCSPLSRDLTIPHLDLSHFVLCIVSS